MREYLARNVIDELPQHLRDFLIQTCVLGKLSASVCDSYLGAGDSARILEELERRQLFTSAVDDEEDYRYHEVLRSHLEAMLLEKLGEEDARVRYRAAGKLLEQAGALPEALRAYCRAEDWEAVRGLVGREGEQPRERLVGLGSSSSRRRSRAMTRGCCWQPPDTIGPPASFGLQSRPTERRRRRSARRSRATSVDANEGR